MQEQSSCNLADYNISNASAIGFINFSSRQQAVFEPFGLGTKRSLQAGKETYYYCFIDYSPVLMILSSFLAIPTSHKPPVMLHSDYKRMIMPDDTSKVAGSFILDTDASDVAIGAALSQLFPDGQERVIAYGSRTLDKSERRYSTTRREMLSLVYFVQYFQPYLVGRPFRVRTDHQALQWLKNFRDPQGQVARWQEKLQEFQFECTYRAGIRHGNADALSRRPFEALNTMFQDPMVETEWSTAQRNDPYITFIYRRQAHGCVKPVSREMSGKPVDERILWNAWASLKMVHGVLYTQTDDQLKVVVPKAKVTEVIRMMHQQLGHPGKYRTRSSIS
ncbi:hypothetical protein T265_02804 [Opisthorchis viverrini]|uniref:Reverse transcriptase RNase H-like domain-containing protein n=1 Tax=Opisthorchis viverrini TaxID=6198 RepID=A0A074ZTS5_OPIVI|nr:hypothetical protein T265_02804 [Opisthorchis viverrini]KER30878.1 hypothetical protein T265_02804 [Opisthorchis viverrini]